SGGREGRRVNSATGRADSGMGGTAEGLPTTDCTTSAMTATATSRTNWDTQEYHSGGSRVHATDAAHVCSLAVTGMLESGKSDAGPAPATPLPAAILAG